MATDTRRSGTRGRPPLLVGVGALLFGIGSLAALASVAVFATGLHGSSAPTWLATTAMLAPIGMALAFAGMWRGHRRRVRALDEES